MFVRNGQKLGSVLVDKASAEPEPSEAEPEPAKDDELDALRAEAEALGIKVDGRWGVDRIREEIARLSEDEEASDGDNQLP